MFEKFCFFFCFFFFLLVICVFHFGESFYFHLLFSIFSVDDFFYFISYINFSNYFHVSVILYVFYVSNSYVVF